MPIIYITGKTIPQNKEKKMELYKQLLNNYLPLLDTTKTFKVLQGVNTEGVVTEDIYLQGVEEDSSTIVTVHLGRGIYKDEVLNNMKGYLSQFLKEEFKGAPTEWMHTLIKI